MYKKMVKIKSNVVSYEEKYLYFLISSKFILDLLSAWRGINFVLFSLVVFFGAGSIIKNRKNSGRFFVFFVIFVVYFFLMSIPNDDYEMGLRFSIAGLFFLVLISNLSMLSADRIVALVNKLIYVLTICILINFLVSVFWADPLNRLFYGFEHANLFGSYVILGFSVLLITSKFISNVFSSFVSLLTLATTSTGAFLLSAVFWIKSYKIGFFNLMFMFIGGLISVIAVYWVSKVFFPDFNDKVFYPFELMATGGLGLIQELALSSVEIQYLGPDRESSLLWRIYAYFIFLDFYLAGDLVNIIFGRGFSSYLGVWSGIAPHNDFLLVLIDFGLVGFALLLFMFFHLWKMLAKIGGVAIGVIIVITTRLALENNIYSFYILTNIVVLLAFSFVFGKWHENKSSSSL